MITDLEYGSLDAVGLAELMRNKEPQPSELLEVALRRAAALNPKLNAIVIPMEELARERARTQLEGPLAGVPFLIKDLHRIMRACRQRRIARALRKRALRARGAFRNREALGSYAVSIFYRFGTFTLWVHGYLQASHNGAERALKTIATGSKAWLFCGSDDHAKSTAALFSVVASARLHRLDVEEYLRCLVRLAPMWPQDRMLELAPLFWSRTRARLDPAQLEAEIGWLAIRSEPLDTSASTEQPAAS